MMKLLEIGAFQVMHIYRAFTGDSVSIDQLLGRGTRIDLVNDPMAANRLREVADG
jgi:hypothetical protein